MFEEEINNDKLNQITAVTCFEIDAKTQKVLRISSIVDAIVQFPLAIALSLFIGYLIFLAFQIPIWICLFASIVIAVIFLYVISVQIVGRLRFVIVFNPDFLQVGRRMGECRIPYEEIEFIYELGKGKLPFCSKKNQACEIRWKHQRVRLFLPADKIKKCIEQLRIYCSNAIYFDESGQEHFPENPASPKLTLKFLKKYYQKKIFCYGILLLVALLSVAVLILILIECLRINVPLKIIMEIIIAESIIIAAVLPGVFRVLKNMVFYSKKWRHLNIQVALFLDPKHS